MHHTFAPVLWQGATENSGDLKSVVLHNLEIKHSKSTFPIALGTRVTAVDDSTYSSIGEAFSTVVLPQSENSNVRQLQADDVSLCYEFAKKVLGVLTSASLRSLRSLARSLRFLRNLSPPPASSLVTVPCLFARSSPGTPARTCRRRGCANITLYTTPTHQRHAHNVQQRVQIHEVSQRRFVLVAADHPSTLMPLRLTTACAPNSMLTTRCSFSQLSRRSVKMPTSCKCAEHVVPTLLLRILTRFCARRRWARSR